jgi:mono/diheme cytochrome c family protein
MKALAAVLALGLLGVVAFWLLSAPGRLDPAVATEMDKPGDAKAGEIIFYIGGCSACHAKSDDPTKLGGGLELKTPFGSIFTPNISPDPDDGLGGWTPRDFATAIYEGVDPHGRFEYPAFPYSSYRNMAVADVRNLWAFLRTLPAVKGKPPPLQFRFPFNVRRAIGIWQLVYLRRVSPPECVQAAKTTAYGRYLVEGPGHCAECHTPRDFLGGPIRSRALSGAPMPSGKGKAPNITPAGLKDWSVDDVDTALTLGLTPDGDSLGGEMADVVRNLSRAPKDYVEDIARYLKEGPK